MAKKSVLIKKELEQHNEHELEQQAKVLIANPRKLILGVTNPYLASELGYHIAKFTSLHVLIIDGDALRPIISTCLGMKELINDKIQTDVGGNSAFNMAMEYVRSSKPVLDIFKKIAVEHPNNKNLSVLTGNDDVQKYEDYSTTNFELLLKQSIIAFDLVIVNVPFNIYDGFYLVALDHVEYMLYGFGAYADDILCFNSLIKYLESCGRSDVKKHQYIPFDYSQARQMSLHDIKLSVDNQFLGVITGDKNRQLLRNEFNKTYSRNMSKKNINEYHRLAKSFGYQTKKGLFGKKG